MLRSATLLPALVMVLGCTDAASGPEGEHVVVIDDHELALCGGTIAYMDSLVRRLNEALGLPLPRGEDRITFHWQDPGDFAQFSPCSETSLGCAQGSEVYSLSAPHNHELVHSIFSTFGGPPALFREGAAVAFEGLDGEASARHEIHSIFIRIDDLIDSTSDEFYESPELQSMHYSIAGEFTAYLVERFGLDAYTALYATLDRDASRADVDNGFDEHFGSSLDEVVAAFEEREQCQHAAYDAKLVECAAPLLAWDSDETLRLTTDLTCADPEAVGPFTGKRTIVLHTLDVAVAGMYRLTLESPEETAELSLIPCGGCGARMTRLYGDSRSAQAELAAGRHALRLHGSAEATTQFDVRIELIN